MSAAISPAVPRARLQAEISALNGESRLADNGRLSVYCAPAARIPWTLQELGRLREITFRAAGEGTGKPSDVDVYDAYYLHLVAWDGVEGRVVGGYRMGLTDVILARGGSRGLYTQTLFTYGSTLLRLLNPAIELGRSFVRGEYQRDPAPLFLLWRAIARFVVRDPRYAILFGAVSISGGYCDASRELIVRFLAAQTFDADLARHVQPRNPLGTRIDSRAERAANTVDELSQQVARLEPDGKGVPVLLRHYLRCGGRLLGFSVDWRFSGVLDGLIMVDLRNCNPRILTRYMGQESAAAFLRYHATPVDHCALPAAHLPARR